MAASSTSRLATWKARTPGSLLSWSASGQNKASPQRTQRTQRRNNERNLIMIMLLLARKNCCLLFAWSLLCTLCALCVLGGKSFAAEPAGITVDKEKKTVSIDAKIAPRKLPNLDQIYPIEVIACFAAPRGEKAHETIVTIEATPSDVHKALESLGLKSGKVADVQNEKPSEGPELNVYIEVPLEGGSTKRVSVNQVLIDIKTAKPL